MRAVVSATTSARCRQRRNECALFDQNRIVMLDGASVLVFSSDGRFLQSVGHHGRGRNEYQGPGEVMALPGDWPLSVVSGSGDPRGLRSRQQADSGGPRRLPPACWLVG